MYQHLLIISLILVKITLINVYHCFFCRGSLILSGFYTLVESISCVAFFYFK